MKLWRSLAPLVDKSLSPPPEHKWPNYVPNTPERLYTSEATTVKTVSSYFIGNYAHDQLLRPRDVWQFNESGTE